MTNDTRDNGPMETTLSEFLLARIAEDEMVASFVSNWDEHIERELDGFSANARRFVVHMGGPARVLAECEAKRRIVERWVATAERTDERGRPAHLFDPVLSMMLKSHERDLRDLAAVYADQDYREEWRA